jgi:predicted peptidase
MTVQKRFLIPIMSLFLALVVNPGFSQREQGKYTLVVEGFDWGAAVSKVILHLEEDLSKVQTADFQVAVERTSTHLSADATDTSGERDIVYAYRSDETGRHAANGQYVTLILEVGPYTQIDAPIQYFFGDDWEGNRWVNYQVAVTHLKTGEIWNTEAGRIMPLVDEFDLTGTFSFNEEITLRYASFEPENTRGKKPLIIWLHGGGEGGADPSLVLLANRATNYAAPEIQRIFGGAYVLAPQSPTFWMQNADGDYTVGEVDDIYHESLMALFKHYIQNHPQIDTDRIYVGGCSNGGYMSQKLLLENPDYFAAAFPSALAYFAEFLSEEDLRILADQSIWYIHAKDDPITEASKTVIPTYQRLLEAGAKEVHLSLYDHVIDLYGLYGGENYHYNGHFSWIYSHRNHCEKVINGKKITLMEWLAAQRK